MGNDKATESLDKTKEVLDKDSGFLGETSDDAKSNIYNCMVEMVKILKSVPSVSSGRMDWIKRATSIICDADRLYLKYGSEEMAIGLSAVPFFITDAKQLGIDVLSKSIYAAVRDELLRRIITFAADEYNSDRSVSNNKTPIAIDTIDPFHIMSHVADIYNDLSGCMPFVNVNSAYGMVISTALLVRLDIKSLKWDETDSEFKQKVQGISMSILLSAIYDGNAVVEQFFNRSKRYSVDSNYYSMLYLYNIVSEKVAIQLQREYSDNEERYKFIQQCELFIMKTDPSTHKWGYLMATTAMQLLNCGQDMMHLKNDIKDFLSANDDKQLIKNGMRLIEQTFAENSQGYAYKKEDIHEFFKCI